MKKSIASVISVAGVLGAGAAAYAVNTSVLTATSSNDLAAVTVPVDTFGATGATTAAPAQPGAVSPAAVGTIPATTQSTTVATVAPLSSTPVAASTRTTYKVGTSGSVVLDTANNILTVVSATPAAGWTAKKIESKGNSIEVEFANSTVEVDFEAWLMNGQIVTDVTSEPVRPPTNDRDDRDDRDEDHHDDDHDDRDHDDDHDEEDD